MKTIITLIGILASAMMSAQGMIMAAEYFIDDDPGAGNGTSIDIVAGNEIEASFAAEINGLDPGFHFIHIRTQDDLGMWSLYTKHAFISQPDIEYDIVASEYFFGDDPGVGNGTSVSIDGGLEIDENTIADTDGLAVGTQMIKVRHQNASGLWGLYSRHMLYATGLNPPHDVIEAEAFFDIDPGVGLGTVVDVEQVNDVDQVLEVPIPADMPEGDHIVYIRIKHSNENWSLYCSHDFIVDNTVGIEEEEVELDIYPNPVADVLQVRGLEGATYELRIVDMTGKAVINTLTDQTEIDVTNLERGNYLIQIETGEVAISRKIVVL